ncbi:hypothetical protein [Streptomyces sp. NRRL S-813]|uniref:hypothetical protein n=1 Tax=Streptomyces sp. NRRL S-813 TaxID=1463919 RepID=UPI0004BE80C4|nr:hypothetical protein [Streptomyces sp. NRRL S-813]
MTASPPKVNGRARPQALQVLGDWQPIEATPATEPSIPASPDDAQPESDLIAQAEAEAIRARAWAEAEEQRLRAEAEADAIRAKAEEEARRLRLNNDKLERKAREDEAASEARIAESRKRKADADRAREESDRQAAEQQQAEAEQVEKRQKTANVWTRCALGFAVVCAVVALPVQMAAFYNPHAKWLLVAPFMLEGGAWVVLQGARAAVDDHRPHWHYRLIAWLLAFIAASINLWHGMHAFDPATAIGTAFASIAGPGVWDLHEHGRIRKLDGKLSRRERRAQRKAERAEAARKAAEEKRRAAEEQAARKDAEVKLRQLTEDRQREFPDVWHEAVKIAAAVGSTPNDEAVWKRAYRNIKGTDPGESIESITSRLKAEARVQSALTGTPVNTLSKTANAQRASQVPGTKQPRVYNPPARRGVRTKGDVKYVSVARRQASITARNAAAKKDQ